MSMNRLRKCSDQDIFQLNALSDLDLPPGL